MTTLKERILAAQDLTSEAVSVPEWGETVQVRVMTGTDRDTLTASMRDAAGNVDLMKYRARLLVRCLINEDGSTMFSETEIDALNAKSSIALDRLFSVADRINGVKPDAVDVAEKN
jgi:hypothetical protein